MLSEYIVPLDSANAWLDRARQSRVILLTDGSREKSRLVLRKKKKFKSAPKARATEQGDPFVVGSPTSHGSSASREMLTARSFAHSASPELLCPSA